MSKNEAPPFTIRTVTWQDAGSVLRTIRERVFMQEQGVPPELEWDGLDEDCMHALAEVGEESVGCARLLRDGHIGRIAVLPTWRGHGIGQALLEHLIRIARQQGHVRVWLDAQVHAIGFYEKAGFTVCSDEFMDAGIPHRRMALALT